LHNSLKIIYIITLIIILYIYFGYPLVIYLLRQIFTKTDKEHQEKINNNYFPYISLFIPAYNEEKVIKTKIKNSLELKYPKDRIEIVVVSDGSTDNTNSIAKNFTDKIRLYNYPKRDGKTNLINKTIPKLRGEIIVFSDASALLEKDALLKLTKHFFDEKIGCVSGKYKILDQKKSTRAKGESIYWNYETFIKKQESKFYSILGAHGALYAMRKGLIKKLPENAINDDYILPMYAVKGGYRAIYEEEAIAWEIAKTSTLGEITRRKRISVGNFQQLIILKTLLNPFKGRISFEFISHKLLRGFAFIFMILLFIINLFLHSPFYITLLFMQIIFYMLGIIGFILRVKQIKLKIFTLPFYIFLINYASLLGFIEFLKGYKETKWEKSTL